MSQNFYAHTLAGRPPTEWQRLEHHLTAVAELTRAMADDFGAGDWAYLAGLWHDLGKYSQKFQQRIQDAANPDASSKKKLPRVDHSTAGAQHAFKLWPDKGKLLAYVIAGHHAGLPEGKTEDAGDPSSLVGRLNKKAIPDSSACPDLIRGQPEPANPGFTWGRHPGFQLSFFIRMIFSCLVDADSLDTERFTDPDQASRRQGYPTLEVLSSRLATALDHLAGQAPPSDINRRRAAILEDCLRAADEAPGLFSLTVPTGGGKTISSLAFALKHALRHGLKRVIYVIPYTSVIEQNAAVFRRILGDEAIVEHHSNYQERRDWREDDEGDDEDQRHRLAWENWDAPLIVTTNVQFFESLFQARRSPCRKIHNIVRSVVILDEAQMLPPDLLRPCLEALRELTTNYQTTIVLCTATQPALSTSATFKDGLDNVREIIPRPEPLYEDFRRVQVNQLGRISDADLAQRLAEYDQVLGI
ncbi:MAG: CRISPR-associated endonuclease Cas3'', partial [Deltaproteobacteria bacterium]|nr:CRISPR-associated endonuclease Cas3'' [Deltaproteobacteria bacterium]